MDATKMTLSDYNPDHVWYTSVGTPTGIDVDLVEDEDPYTGERYEIDPADVEGMVPFSWDLEGTVDERGRWQWDGEGDPRDSRWNTVTRITAYRES